MRYHSINIKTRILSLLVTLSVIQTAVAQNTTQLLDLYFKEVRLGKYPPIPKPLSLNENSATTLKAISPYLVSAESPHLGDSATSRHNL